MTVLSFDQGTLLLNGETQMVPSGFVRDERIGGWRAEGFRYRETVLWFVRSSTAGVCRSSLLLLVCVNLKSGTHTPLASRIGCGSVSSVQPFTFVENVSANICNSGGV